MYDFGEKILNLIDNIKTSLDHGFNNYCLFSYRDACFDFKEASAFMVELDKIVEEIKENILKEKNNEL